MLMIGMSACSLPTEGKEVWNTYDVRHPVRADSSVPDAYARQYDPYMPVPLSLGLPYPIDNDTYYSQPSCSILDAPNCVSGE